MAWWISAFDDDVPVAVPLAPFAAERFGDIVIERRT
jgi:hypothetical protein